ncbi:MAG: TonB-dependent receptor [Spirosomaceae bacterium]|nr:TonB-dependent receptor [Spirosomataceae bacterium]
MRQFSIVLLTLLVSFSAIAQTGTIRGKIVDKDQNLSLPGASVILTDLKQGAATDVNGQFVLVKVPAGRHNLKISYIGYESQTQEVEVTTGQTVTLNFMLKSGAISTDEVLVMGDRLLGQAKALNQQRTNINVTNIVAADQIGRFPDANIGDAMKRIPGITVQNDQGEARYGLVRGTEARLNSVMVNGERLPSAEAGVRNVQLDLIPADMIQSIEVSKALTPDMDADAIGGAVNLVTRAAPNKTRISATVAGGSAPIRGFNPFQGSLILGKRFFDNKLGVILSGNYNNNRYGSDNIEKVWDRTSAADGSVPFMTDFQIRKYDVWRIRRSVSLGLDYKIGTHSTIYFKGIVNRRDDYENRFRARYRLNQASTGNTVGTGTTRYRGLPNAQGLVTGARVEYETKGGADDVRNARLERQTTTSYNLGGEHLIANKLKMNWSATYAYASEDRPREYYMTFRYNNVTLRPNTTDAPFSFVDFATPLNYATGAHQPFQVRNDFTDERDFNARMDFTLPLNTKGKYSNSVKFGLRLRDKAKEQRQSRGNFVPPTGTNVTWANTETQDYSDAQYTRGGAPEGTYKVGPFPTPAELGRFQSKYNAAYVDAPASYLGANFTATENITGGYAMLNQNLGEKLFMLAGVRLENTSVNYTANATTNNFTTVTPVTGQSSYTNVMPSLHFKYDLRENTIVRLAWTNTLARPNYADLAPTRNRDIPNNTITAGNPALKATTSMNFDLMLEHYFKSVGLIQAGVFHKNLKNIVLQRTLNNYTDPFDGQTYLRFTQPQNGNEATLTGFEVAVQRQLDFLPGFLKGFGIYTNYTYNQSNIASLPGTERTDFVLPGTAKHNFNASLSYETKKLVLRASYNWHSAFIDPEETTFNDNAFFDRYQDAMEQLDFNGSFAFTPKFRVFVEATNLTNQPLRFYQGEPRFTQQNEYYSYRVIAGLKFDL